jgi:CheY-like chemotaxis protein
MDGKQKTILVVEDDPGLQEAIKLKLKKDGLKTLSAGTGEEAIDVLKNNPDVDLVWLDYLLPKMDGLEVLQKVRQDPEIKNVKVIVVSVSSSPEKMKQAYALDIVGYIVKSEGTLDNIVKRVEGFIV